MKPKKAASTKYQMVRDQLADAIKAGEFAASRRLPSERELAEQFNISRMTARRAIEDLEQSELIVRRGGSGSYVRDTTQDRLENITVHQICMTYENSLMQDFLRITTQNIEQRGWLSHIVRVQTGYERAAIQALNSGEPAIVWVSDADLQGPMGPILEQAHDRVVLLGNYLEESQIPCVLADDDKAVHIAMRHLQDRGHQKIAFIRSFPGSKNEFIQAAAWHDCMESYRGAEELEHQLIAVKPLPMTDATEYGYDAICRYLREEMETGAEPTTAFVTTADELAVGAMAACRDMGRPVPEHISLINLQDNPAMKFARPPVSCVNIDIGGQIGTAFRILDEAVAGRPSPFKKRIMRVEPRLVERSSVVELALKV